MEKVTHYYLEQERSLALKNKLQQDLNALFRSMDGLLIEKSNLESFKKKLEEEVKKINEKYPRMKSITVSYNQIGHGNKRIYVKTIDALTFILLPSRLVDFNEINYNSKNN
ncbi:hypothetical protein [Flavobacterium sp. HNIBRBA15423]|uniref:hypothetical protein n=1 Tax=Flavobacterium sp. HNIBRBA15423 TaxID=3458683 RepID=UPI0040441628